MTSIGSKSFNWLPRTSAWQDAQNWHAKMKAANSHFQETLSGFGETLLSAPVTQSSSVIQLATQKMVSRIQAERLAAAQAAAKAAKVEKGVQDPAIYWGRDDPSYIDIKA